MPIDFPDESEPPKIQIDLTPEFQRNLRDLKRYRNVQADVQVAIAEMQAGNFIGDRLVEIGEGYVGLKVRVRNRDIQKGKSGGYRLIYQIESPTSILLLTIYAKSEREDISMKKIREILGEFYEN